MKITLKLVNCLNILWQTDPFCAHIVYDLEFDCFRDKICDDSLPLLGGDFSYVCYVNFRQAKNCLIPCLPCNSLIDWSTFRTKYIGQYGQCLFGRLAD